MSSNKLFFVEFGQPQESHMFSFGGSGGSVKPIYVVANDYTGASIKANQYLQNYLAKNPENQSILDSDGSLRNNILKSEKIQIIAVKLLSDEIIY
jgi:hypothetical protein